MTTKPPASDANADALGIFREVRILNEAATFGYPHNVINEYIRIKIFTDRGRDKYGTVQIPYWGKTIISNISGRTIKPNGAIVELKKEDVFEKVIEQKRHASKVHAVSFALPAVEPGSVIEYRFTRNVGEFISRYVPVFVQSEYPVRELTIHVKPVSGTWVQWPTMRYYPFGCNVQQLPPETGGFSGFIVRDIPAFHEEPYMPPEFNAKKWVLFYYEENENAGKPDKYWASYGRSNYKTYSSEIKIDKDIKQIAEEETSGAKADEERVDKLFEYCRKNLKDVYGTEITTEERERAKENHNTSNTFRNKEGTLLDISLAFAALAKAAGFEAHLARTSDRSQFLFDPKIQTGFFLNDVEVAVKIGDKWRFYSLAHRWTPPGQLPWEEQGVETLIEDPSGPAFATTPLLPADKSAVQRIATLKLSPEGTLEGDIREIYLGNKAVEWRQRLGLANDAERETALREDIKERFAEFELSNVKFQFSPDLAKGVGVVYHISVSNYAQHTGKRMFINPGYFVAGSAAQFVDNERTLPIYFPYPWSESDYVELQLPEGYQLDHADSPAPLHFAPTLTYAVTMSITKSNKLIYQRNLVFGGNTIPVFDAKSYPTLKKIFDHIHDSDNHMLTLKSGVQTSAEVH